MPTRQEVLTYLVQRNGATNKDMAVAFGIAPNRAACYTKQYFDKGYVTRKITGRTPSGREVYTYYAHADVTPAIPKQERLKVVRKRQDNGEGSLSLDGLVATLADTLAKQIAAQVMTALQTNLTRELTAVIPQALPAPKVDLAALVPAAPLVRQDKPRVGIVGLLPVQQECITKEFGDVFELRFWKDESVSSLKAMGRSCEIVLVSKWCGHSDTEALSAVGAQWRRVDGGLSQLKDTLTTLYVGVAA